MSAPTLVTEPQSEAHHVDALPAGSRLGEFEVVSLLGVGGFGMVYKAFDHSLLRFVAIKEYMPTALAARAQGQSLWVRSSSHEQSFQAGLASFVAEARLLAQFDHPSLVKVFRFWEANQTAYMVMPLYEGMTLKQARAHMRTPPPEAWLRKVLWSVLGALRVLHEGQTLHRDISPDNIFLQDSGLPVLLDLGAARHAITDHSHRLTAVLKVNYAPIEQYNDEGNDLRQGPWSDLYSVGAVVHGCLCNDTPLPATLRAIRDRMVPFSRVAKTVKRQFGVEYSPPFVAAISQALALQPQDRPQSIDEFLRTLGMAAPPEGMEQFDFRAELGDIWVEPADRRAAGVAVPMIDITSVPAPMSGLPVPEPMAAPVLVPEPAAVTTVLRRSPAPAAGPERAPRAAAAAAAGGDTVFLDSTADAGDSWFGPAGAGGPGGAAMPGPAGVAVAAPAAGRKPRMWALAAVAVVALGASAAGGAWWAARSADGQPAAAATVAASTTVPRTPEEEIITETVEPPPAAAAAVPAASSAPAAPEPAQHGASQAGPRSATASVPAAAASSARNRPPVRKAAEPAVVAAPAAPAASLAVAVPAAPPKPAPRVIGPDEACADAGFLARPMCIHQECQRPAVANHPLCVENRRRLEAEERRRLMQPQ